MINKMRYAGNTLALIGYAVLLNVDPVLGGIMKLIGLALALPSCMQLKLYDVMFMLGLFGFLDLMNVIKHLTN